MATGILSYTFVIFGIINYGAALPNILLLFPDEWRFDWADDYYLDLDIKTPTFNSVVSNGTRFINTLAASPICSPSRACIATGKEYDECGMPENMQDLPRNQTTIYQLLQASNYYTMITGKDDLTKKTGVGVDGTYRAKQLGYSAQVRCLDKTALPAMWPNVTDPYEAYLSNLSLYDTVYDCDEDCCTSEFDLYECPTSLNVSDEVYQDNWITTNSLKLLEDKPKHKPWFFQINFVGPHPPFIILQDMNETVNNRSFPKAMDSTFSPEDMQVVRRDYTAEVENLDIQFQIIIDKVVEMGEYNNTVICISSDHGEMLGDFSTWQKGKPWIASTNVPLVCQGPDIVAGQVISTYMTLLDLAGTFLDYTNTSKDADMTTTSIRPFLNGTWNDEDNGYRDYVSSGYDNWRLVVKQVNATTTWKYICCQQQCPGRAFTNATIDGYTKLLFNLIADPYEVTNVYDEYPNVVDELQSLLPSGFCS